MRAGPAPAYRSSARRAHAHPPLASRGAGMSPHLLYRPSLLGDGRDRSAPPRHLGGGARWIRSAAPPVRRMRSGALSAAETSARSQRER